MSSSLIPQDRLSALQIDLIGAGAIGRQLALQLAICGARSLRIFDPDVVDVTNVRSQGYSLHSDVGRLKVDALRETIARFDPTILVEPVRERYRPKYGARDAVFLAVDSILTRSAIWKSVRTSCEFLCDGRLQRDVIRIVTAADSASRRHYSTTLFTPVNSENVSCATDAAIYSASIAAGLMVHQFARWLRGHPINRDVTLNLFAGELHAV